MNKFLILLLVGILIVLFCALTVNNQNARQENSKNTRSFGHSAPITELPFPKAGSIYENYTDADIKEIIDYYNSGSIDTKLGFLDKVTSGKILDYTQPLEAATEYALNESSIKELLNLLRAPDAISRPKIGNIKMCSFETTYAFIFYFPEKQINLNMCFNCNDLQFSSEKEFSAMHSFTPELEAAISDFIEEQKDTKH